jgi:hypothetical protein
MTAKQRTFCKLLLLLKAALRESVSGGERTEGSAAVDEATLTSDEGLQNELHMSIPRNFKFRDLHVPSPSPRDALFCKRKPFTLLIRPKYFANLASANP